MEHKLNTIHDLRLVKQQFKYDVKLQEELLGSEFRHLRHNFDRSLKLTARKYTQKLAIAALLNFARKRFR